MPPVSTTIASVRSSPAGFGSSHREQRRSRARRAAARRRATRSRKRITASAPARAGWSAARPAWRAERRTGASRPRSPQAGAGTVAEPSSSEPSAETRSPMPISTSAARMKPTRPPNRASSAIRRWNSRATWTSVAPIRCRTSIVAAVRCRARRGRRARRSPRSRRPSAGRGRRRAISARRSARPAAPATGRCRRPGPPGAAAVTAWRSPSSARVALGRQIDVDQRRHRQVRLEPAGAEPGLEQRLNLVVGHRPHRDHAGQLVDRRRRRGRLGGAQRRDWPRRSGW